MEITTAHVDVGVAESAEVDLDQDLARIYNRKWYHLLHETAPIITNHVCIHLTDYFLSGSMEVYAAAFWTMDWTSKSRKCNKLETKLKLASRDEISIGTIIQKSNRKSGSRFYFP